MSPLACLGVVDLLSLCIPYPQVGVRVEAEDMRTGIRHHCCSAYLTFVAVGPSKGQQQQSSNPALPATGTTPSTSDGTGQALSTASNPQGSSSSSNGAGSAGGTAKQGHSNGSAMATTAAAALGAKASGGPQSLPRVLPVTPEQQRIYAEAEERRSARLAQRAALRGDPALAAAIERCR
jgi:acyl-CoA hydrolase